MSSLAKAASTACGESWLVDFFPETATAPRTTGVVFLMLLNGATFTAGAVTASFVKGSVSGHRAAPVGFA